MLQGFQPNFCPLRHIFKDIATTLDDAEITMYENNMPIDARNAKTEDTEHCEPRRSRFKFSMCGIKVGETITFDPTGLVVRVASDDSIEYEDRIYKLSPFVGTFMPEERRNLSGAYQGAKYFSYRGKVLDDIRKERETGND